MRRVLPIILGTLLFTQGASSDEAGNPRVQELLSRDWDYKLISSGDNRPGLELEKEHLGELLILLHEDVSQSEIAEQFGWSSERLGLSLKLLQEAGLVEPSTLKPTVLIMTEGEVARHMPLPTLLIRRAADLIVDREPEFRELFSSLSKRGVQTFEENSLLFFSNVALDNWQIRNVEKRFLKAERPSRGGKNYYYSIQENLRWNTDEAFSIYGNQVAKYGSSYVGVYGNQREGNPKNFHELTGDKVGLLKRFLEGRTTDEERETLTDMGWLDENEVNVLVFSSGDLALLDQASELVTEPLLELLEEYRPLLTQAYQESPYRSEVSFEEYFIWWYHLFYSEVTDNLIVRKEIELPVGGLNSYIFVPD